MINRFRKGQMSLEMVIGLVILLVVAGVVISLLLHYLSPGSMPNPGNRMEVNDFLSKCQKYCQDKNTIEYCKYYFDGNDYDLDGQSNELIKVGDFEWDACEDRVYCFLVEPCKRFTDNPVKGCAEQLCRFFKVKYDGNLSLTSDAILEKIIGTTDNECNASLKNLPVEENWKIRYFNKSYGSKNLCEHYIG